MQETDDPSLEPSPVNPHNFKWRLIGKYKNEFPGHYTLVFVSEEVGFFILGGNGNPNTCLNYDFKTLKVKA